MAGYIATSFGQWALHFLVLVVLVTSLGFSMYGLGKSRKDTEGPAYTASLIFGLILSILSGAVLALWFSDLEVSRNCINACDNFVQSVSATPLASPVI